MNDRVLEPVAPTLGKEQPLLADDCVQRLAAIVQNVQQFGECPHLCLLHQRVQLRADHRSGPPDQFVQSGSVLLGYAAPPPPSPSTPQCKRGHWQPQTGITSAGVCCRC